MPIHISARDLKRLHVDDATATAQPQPKAPSRPRAARGEGDRQRDLAKLAAAGFTLYESRGGRLHHFRDPATGRTTPEHTTYRAAVDAALDLAGLSRRRRA